MTCWALSLERVDMLTTPCISIATFDAVMASWNDLQARMVKYPGVPVDERTDLPSSFFPTQPHSTVWVQACTMTRMDDLFKVSSARAQQ